MRPVVVLQDVGVLAVVEPRHDDVAALDQPDPARARCQAQDSAEDLGDPRAGGVDHARVPRPCVASPAVGRARGRATAPPSRRAATQRVRVRIVGAALARRRSAFSTTRRASSTQQSEYSKPRR